MKRYWLLSGLILIGLGILFLVFEALELPLLTDPLPWLERAGPLAALIGVGLLLVDVVAPVPSSIVMVAHGALYGIVGGTLLSLVGSLGATLIAFAVGRRGGRLLAWLVSPEERAQADRLLDRWGGLAILLTRPIPLLAETVAILAGASPMRWRQTALAALAGSLPTAVVYAVTGATAARAEYGLLVFGLVLLLTVVAWLIVRRQQQPSAVADQP